MFFQVKDESDEFCRLYGLSEVAFLDHIRESQGERAREILDREGEGGEGRQGEGEGEDEAVAMPLRNLDARMFNPTAVKRPDGMPDIERLREIYQHSNG